MMQFSASEVSDIRIALQDRVRLINEARWAYQSRNGGHEDGAAKIEVDRLEALIKKTES